MTIHTRWLPGVLGGVASLLVLSGCGNGVQVSDNADNGKIAVVASTDVLGSVVSAVGGDYVQVTSLINSPSKDPHDYESSSEDALNISKAKLVISNGGGYDAFFDKAVSALGDSPKHVVAFDLAGNLAGRAGSEPNEHVFYDLPTVRKVADKVATDLGGLAPKGKATFTANARKFATALARLQAKAVKIGTTHPGLRAVAAEPVADYLLRIAGVRIATPPAFAEAVEHDIDVPAQALAQTNNMISGKKVNMLVNNDQTETPTTDQLKATAKRAGVPVVDVTETLPAGTTSYLSWMGKMVDDLGAAAGEQQ